MAQKSPAKTEPVVDAQALGHDEDQSNSGHHAHNALADNIPGGGNRESNGGQVLDRMEQVVQICGGFLLQVTCDHLSAFLSKTCGMDPDIPAVVIRTALAEKGIVFGLASDERIEAFIRSAIADSIFFSVAKGSPGKDTKIVDSKIECSGACSIITGMLVSSRVSVKMGLMARSIRSGTADPSRIRVGHDAFAARELEKNSAGTMRLEEILQNLGKKKNTIRRQAAGLKKQMTELDRDRERIQVQCREIESRPELLPGDRVSLNGH